LEGQVYFKWSIQGRDVDVNVRSIQACYNLMHAAVEAGVILTISTRS
jgi:hypothetical protein